MSKEKSGVSLKDYYDGKFFSFDRPENENNHHYFMAEELNVPLANHADCQRLQMFSSHMTQTVHLKNPEYPKIFTNFENQIGEYSVSYKKAQEDFTIIAKIEKNALNCDYIIQYNNSKVYDVIHFRKAEHITEEYGYGKIDCLENKIVGDQVKKGDFVYKTANYDEEGNFGYGVNLKADYCPYFGLTYEDAVVISKSAAKKLTSYKCEESIISVNGNDVLLNLYAKPGESYHAFPHVGEHTLDNILVASRREENQTILYNFQYDKMKKIQPNDDITYTNGGIVADLDIYCNTPLDVLKKKGNEFTKEIVQLLEQQNAYYENAAKELEKIVPIATEHELVTLMTQQEKTDYYNERKEFGFNWTRPTPSLILEKNGIVYTEEFGYFWKKVHEYLDNRITWRSKGKSFQFLKIKFTILKEIGVIEGDKITNRYGGKGIVSLIEDDEKFPVLPDGSRVEVFLNPLGILNRMIPASILEAFINFVSDHVVAEMKTKNLSEQIDLYLEYLSYLNQNQYAFMKTKLYSMTKTEQIEFIKDILENGIYIHEPPFFGNTSYETLKKLYKEHPEWCTRYKFEGMERPQLVGDIYFIKLKHAASNKTSYVASATTNTKDIPSKSNLKKNHKTLFLTSPIMLGNMETENMLLSKNGKVLEKLLKSYSTSKVDRENLVKKLLTANNPFDISIDLENDVSINRKILEKYLSVLELSLENNDKK